MADPRTLERGIALLHEQGPEAISPTHLQAVLDEETRRLSDPDTGLVYFARYYGLLWVKGKGWLRFMPDGKPRVNEKTEKHWGWQAQTWGLLTKFYITLILKARQLGLTFTCSMVALWEAQWHGLTASQVVAVVTNKMANSKRLVRRSRDMYRRQPEWLNALSPISSDGITRLEFANGSSIEPFAGNEDASRAEAASVVLVDEVGRIEQLDSVFASLEACADNGGRIIMWGTIDERMGNAWAQLREWVDDCLNGEILPGFTHETPDGPIHVPVYESEAGMSFIFLPWLLHADRDLAWYEKKKALYKGNLKKFGQEYPACLTSEIRVSTQRGIIPISEVCELDTHSDSGEIKAFWPQPSSQIYKLTTRRGRVIRGTFNHPVKMEDDGFVWLSALEPGQRIALQPPIFSETNHTEEWSSPGNVSHSVTMTPEFARFIGYFMGDGCWHKGTVSVACTSTDLDTIDDVTGLLEQFVGTPKPRFTGKNGGCTEVRVCRKETLEPFTRIGLLTKRESDNAPIRHVHVPDAIFRSSRDCVIEFLKSLFECDAYSSTRRVAFASKHLEFVREVQLLLTGLGINSTIARETKVRGGFTFYCYALRLSVNEAIEFHRIVGFVSERKNSTVPKVNKQGRPPQPNEMVDEVLSVELDGFEVTYDLTIEPTHVFSANGILTHNSPEDMFIGSGQGYFDHDALVKSVKVLEVRQENGDSLWESRDQRGVLLWENEARKTVKFVPDACGDVVLHCTPAELDAFLESRRPFNIGVDCAGDRPEGDYHAASGVQSGLYPIHEDDVVKPSEIIPARQLLTIHGYMDADLYAAILVRAGYMLGTAQLTVEANGVGVNVLKGVRKFGYPNIYMRRTKPDNKRDKATMVMGYYSTQATKHIAYGETERLLRNGWLEVRDIATLGEMTFIRSLGGGALGAPKPKHDDRSDGLTLAVAGLSTARIFEHPRFFQADIEHEQFSVKAILAELEREKESRAFLGSERQGFLADWRG